MKNVKEREGKHASPNRYRSGYRVASAGGRAAQIGALVKWTFEMISYLADIVKLINAV
jgi:hypothetical protein